MNYDKIAQSVIRSAVQTHLRQELKQHTASAAKAAANSWLRKNRTRIASYVNKLVQEKLEESWAAVAKRAANKVTLKVRNGYY